MVCDNCGLDCQLDITGFCFWLFFFFLCGVLGVFGFWFFGVLWEGGGGGRCLFFFLFLCVPVAHGKS